VKCTTRREVLIPEEVESVKTIPEEPQTTLEELQLADLELHLKEELAAARQTVTERQRYQELFEFAPDAYS